MPNEVEEFVKQFSCWADGQADILAVILVGSRARGKEKPDSDMDLVIICREPEQYLEETNWVREFGTPIRQLIEDWGKVTSLRVWFEGGLEVEFGITDEDWLKVPLDAGTKSVLEDGYRILFDRNGKVSNVLARD